MLAPLLQFAAHAHARPMKRTLLPLPLLIATCLPATAAGAADSWRQGWGLARGTGQAGGQPRYRLPFDATRFTVGQAPEGRFSHRDAENRFAVDFTLPEGTPVLAARAGRVIDLQAGFSGNGLDPQRDRLRANYVRIRHADGSIAVYAHLLQDGVRVRTHQWVEAGQTIALSGNTGFSTAPHLHFAVQHLQGERLVSIPVQFDTPRGRLHLPKGDGAD